MHGAAMHKYLRKVQQAFSHRCRKPITSSTLSSSQIKKIRLKNLAKDIVEEKRGVRCIQKSDTSDRHVLKTVLIAGLKKFSKIDKTKQNKKYKTLKFNLYCCIVNVCIFLPLYVFKIVLLLRDKVFGIA